MMKDNRAYRNLLLLAVLSLAYVLLAPQSAIGFIARGEATFPPLTGPYPVGKTIVLVESHPTLWLYYPAAPTATDRRAPYTDLALAQAVGLPYPLPALVGNHAYANPAPASDGPYPVLLFSHALNAIPLYYSTLLEEIASHGYVVVAIWHAQGSSVTLTADGQALRAPAAIIPADVAGQQRLAEAWLAEAQATLDWLEQSPPPLLAGRLDLERVGMFGHSIGGATAVHALARDSRVRAALNMDGSLLLSEVRRDGVAAPVMVLASPWDTTADFLAQQQRDTVIPPALYNRATPCYVIQFPQARHQAFATDLLWMTPLFPFTTDSSTLGSLERERGFTLISGYIRAFFDKHLRGLPAPLLEASPPPEVLLEISQP